LGWNGTILTTLMLSSERPKISLAKRRPIFVGEQLEQTIAAAREPFRTLFVLAALTGARVSELCGLAWAEVRIHDVDEAEIEFGWQADRRDNRRPTKTGGVRPDGADLARARARARPAQAHGTVLRAERLCVRDANRQAPATAHCCTRSQGGAGARN
jgi:integrase